MKCFTRIPFLICAVAVFALFSRTATCSYIGLDDAAYTFRNPFVAGGLSASNVVEAFTNLRHGGIWMPVTYVSYMFDASLCRLTGLPLVSEMHVVNVILHVINFLLLWKLICLLFSGPTATPLSTDSSQPSTGVVAFAAMMWAVHPLRVEPVAWIAARKELLWTLFTLSGLFCWTKFLTLRNVIRHQAFDTQNSTCDHQQRPAANVLQSALLCQLSTVICCALACLAKPTAMCFPLLSLLMMWWKRKTDDIRHSTTDSPPSPSVPRQLQVFTSPLSSPICSLSVVTLIACATAAMAAYSQTHVAGREATALYAIPLTHRLVNALSAAGFYLKATIWPFGLHVDCRSVVGLWPLDAGWNLAMLGIVVGVVCLLIWFLPQGTQGAQRRGGSSIGSSPLLYPRSSISCQLSTLIFAFVWFLASLLPTLGIFGSFGIEAHADRFTYFPAMAFSFLIVSFFRTQRRRDAEMICDPVCCSWFQCGAIGCCLVIILFLLALTFNQLGFWRDDATAHQHALTCDPEHPRAMVHVADARCSRQGDLDAGIRLYRRAIAHGDTVPKGGFDVEDVKARLAYALATRGRQEDFAEVKRIGSAVFRDNRLDRRGLMLDALGTAYMQDGDVDRAALLFKASIAAPDRFWPKASTQRKLAACCSEGR